MKTVKIILLQVMFFLAPSILVSGEFDIEMSDYKDYLENNARVNWDQYPYYTAYVKIMEKWATDYPQICSLHDLGPGVNNRKILALKVSGNVNVNEPEPRFMQIATAHGDELLDFMFTLHTIDTLLSSYGNDERLTTLVDKIEFWFCPLVNPDATYKGGDTTIEMSQRFNMNSVDLNGNWPCACMVGDHKLYGKYKAREPEIAALMSLHDRYRFNLHIDMHGGTSAIIWPFGGKAKRPCDEHWYRWACERMAGQMHEDCNNNGYMTACGLDGIGNYYHEMYEAHGSRIDFCDRYAQIKGVLFENWGIKHIPYPDEIREYWPYNREALFQYYELLYTGIQGVVKDASTKEPIYQANMTAQGHDIDSASVFTDSTGFFCRFINTGTYDFTFSHPDYQDTTISGFLYDDYSKKIIFEIELHNAVGAKKTTTLFGQCISLIQIKNGIKIHLKKTPDNPVNVSVYDINGKLVKVLSPQGRIMIWDGKDLNGGRVSKGCYVMTIQNDKDRFTKNFVLY